MWGCTKQNACPKGERALTIGPPKGVLLKVHQVSHERQCIGEGDTKHELPKGEERGGEGGLQRVYQKRVMFLVIV